MLYVLYVLFFISCIVLVGSVLLQPGKTDAGALFTSNISNAAFGPRGTGTVLARVTIIAASCFMVLALLISMPALQGGVSVLQSTSPETPTQNAPAEVPAANDANAAPAANTETPANAAPASNSGASNSAPSNQ